MKLGLNTYSVLGTFDSNLGNHYIIMCNKSRSKFMPIMLSFSQKTVLMDYGTSGSKKFLGIYTSLLDMWASIDCNLSAMVMKPTVIESGEPGVDVDLILTQVGEDGMHILHSSFPIGDAAIISVLTKMPIFVGEDTVEISTIDINLKEIDDSKLMEAVIHEVNQCEKILSEGPDGIGDSNPV